MIRESRVQLHSKKRLFQATDKAAATRKETRSRRGRSRAKSLREARMRFVTAVCNTEATAATDLPCKFAQKLQHLKIV